MSYKNTTKQTFDMEEQGSEIKVPLKEDFGNH